MKIRLNLWSQLTVVFVTVLVLVTSIMFGLTLRQNSHQIRANSEKILVSEGEQLAIDPQVINALKGGKTNRQLQDHIEKIRNISKFDFIVVMDMAAIRYTHPDSEKIGKHFQGGDEIYSLKGKEHISISKGSLGESLRCFVPVYSETSPKKQIGVVALGLRLQSLTTLINDSQKYYIFILALSLMVGILVSSILTYFLKKQLNNLEPKEITKLFEERNAMLNNTKDIVAVIDMDKKIKLANIAALDFYKLNVNSQNDLINKSLNELLIGNDEIKLEKNTEQLYRLNGQDYIFSCAPIITNNKQVGWIIFLKNISETVSIIDQLSNATAFANILQNQSHEFMNKLHVIYGLVDLKSYDELQIYLNDILQPEKNSFTYNLTFLVKNSQIAGFLTETSEKFTAIAGPIEIEFLSEIPKNYFEQETKTIIRILQYFNQIFLESDSMNLKSLKLLYHKGRLEINYCGFLSEYGENNSSNRFKNQYVNRLLESIDGQLIVENNHENQINIIIETDYRGEKE